MRLSVKFNGVELSSLISVVHGFNPFIGTDWSPQTRSTEASAGSRFINTSTNEKTITMPFLIKNNVKENYDKLQSILNVSQPKQLIFGNMSDRFFMAVPTGNISLVETGNDFSATGTITWLIPSGVAESIKPTEVDVKVVNGILTAEIDNDSSAEVFPIYRIKNNAENGYVGIVHAGGAFEMGNREEVDGVTRPISEMLLDTTNFSEFTPYTGLNPENPNKLNNGTLSYVNQGGYNLLRLNSLGTGNAWHGGAMVYTLPADSKGIVGAEWFNTQSNGIFWAGANGQTAQMQLLYLTSDNKLIMGYSIAKDDIIGNSARIIYHYSDGKGGTIYEAGRQNFIANHVYWDNPFRAENGDISLRKEGSMVRFFSVRGSVQATVPELENVKVAKVMICVYQYGNRNGSQLVTFAGMRSTNFFKNNVEDWLNVPNRYPENNELIINCEDASISINGIKFNDEMITGSRYAPLSIGKTIIEFYLSSWANADDFDITVEYYKRWN